MEADRRSSLATLALLGLSGFGRKTVQRLLIDTENPPDDSEGLTDLISRADTRGRSLPQPSESEVSLALDRAARLLDTCESMGIRVMNRASPLARHWRIWTIPADRP